MINFKRIVPVAFPRRCHKQCTVASQKMACTAQNSSRMTRMLQNFYHGDNIGAVERQRQRVVRILGVAERERVFATQMAKIPVC